MWLPTACLLLLSSYIAYNLFFHPLARVPGPFLARITRLWLVYKMRQHIRHQLDTDLHREYGSVVRISPDEIIFSNPEHFRAVYGAGTHFTKSHWYEAPTDKPPGPHDGLDMLTETQPEKLRLQRRLVGPAYSVSGVKRHENAIDKNIVRFLGTLESLAGKPIEPYSWFERLSTDVFTEVTYGKAFGAVEKGSDGGQMETMDGMWQHWAWIGLLPWLNRLDKIVGTVAQVFSSLHPNLPVFGMARLEAGRQAGSQRTQEVSDDSQPALAYKVDVGFGQSLPVSPLGLDGGLQKLSKDRPEYGSHTIEDSTTDSMVGEDTCLYTDLRDMADARADSKQDWAQMMALTDLGAGVDTMSWTLATVIAAVSQNNEVEQKLYDEVSTAGFREGGATSYDQASKCRYLEACMHEAQRLWLNIAMSLARDTPAEGITIDGYYIPAGYTVGMHSRTLGLNNEIFGKDTQSFKPERWLDVSKERRTDMESRNLAFGRPSRKCPGMHLAWVCMVKILAGLFVSFDVKTLNSIGKKGTGGHVWEEKSCFLTKWSGWEIQLSSR